MRPLLAIAVVLVVAGCGSSGPPSFVETAKSAKSLTIYEGVPRDGPNPSDKPTMKLAEEAFYSGKHPVSGPAADAIAKLLGDPSVFKSHGERKACGGFHADYAVEWDGPEGPLRVLLCFGCGEVRSIGDGKDTLVDLTHDGEARLEAAVGKAMGK